MISSSIIRSSRRLAGTASAQSRRCASSSAARATADESKRYVALMAAATATGLGLFATSREDEANNAQCLFSKSDSAAQQVEAKFGTYWPRNISESFPFLLDVNVEEARIVSYSTWHSDPVRSARGWEGNARAED